MKRNQPLPTPATLPKSPIGITSLDEITGGVLPRGRPTLVSGGAGCGKTMLALEFLVRRATQFGEPGVFKMFEENTRELSRNREFVSDGEASTVQESIRLRKRTQPRELRWV